MTAPSFIDRDGSTIISEMVTLYQDFTGRTIQPAQAEMLLINAFAYRELLLREEIQSVAEQMLVDFARAPALDYLGALVGVTRLSASAASCTIRFSLVSGHGGVVIPSGLRVGSTDGRFIFTTQQNTTVLSGVNTSDILCYATNEGAEGNGYQIGEISTILDPQPYLSTASNTDISAGGSDSETDDNLRERIKIAPSQFSVAGPKEAYIFFAKSASTAILDVGILSSVPGTVEVYPLTEGGTTPGGVLALVEAALNDERVRPLSDTVVVASPTVVNYAIELEVVIYTDADSGLVQAAIEAAAQTYVDNHASVLGLDVIKAQVLAIGTYDNTLVYNCTVIEPAADVVIDENEVAICTGITVTITGQNEG